MSGVRERLIVGGDTHTHTESAFFPPSFFFFQLFFDARQPNVCSVGGMGGATSCSLFSFPHTPNQKIQKKQIYTCVTRGDKGPYACGGAASVIICWWWDHAHTRAGCVFFLPFDRHLFLYFVPFFFAHPRCKIQTKTHENKKNQSLSREVGLKKKKTSKSVAHSPFASLFRPTPAVATNPPRRRAPSHNAATPAPPAARAADRRALARLALHHDRILRF